MQTDEEFDKKFKELPEDVRGAMTSVNTVEILTALRVKYNLHIDQLGELSAEVGMLMIGETHPQEFVGKVEENLHVSREIALQIATEVNEKIFRPVRESLMLLYKMKEKKEAEDKSTGEIPADEITVDKEMANKVPEEEEDGKDFTEKKLTESFSIPKKIERAPDPYRETV